MERSSPPPSSAAPSAAEPDLWWRHLAVLAWVALYLVGLEVVLEVRAHRRGWDTLLFGAPRDAQDEIESGFGPTEAFPFRSRVVPPAREPGTLRVWVASASYALGGNLPPEEIFAVRLVGDLAARGVKAEVLNAGRVAYAIPDSVAALEAGAPLWRPDVAVLYHLSTDVDDLSRRLAGGGGLEAAAGAEGLDWGTRLVELTTLQPLLKEHLGSRVTRWRPLSDDLGTAGAAAFEARVRSFVEVCRRHGIAPVLCTFAVSHDRANPEDLPPHVFRFNLRVSRRGWHDTIDRWNDLLRRVAAEEGAPLVDVAGALLGRSDRFVDFVHFASAGHGEVSRLLAEALAPLAPADGGRR